MLQVSNNEASILILVLEIGSVIIFSIIVAQVLGKRGIPQVLGLIFAGIVLQFLTEATGFPSPPTPELHYIITTGALGFIGYSIGAHLDLNRLKQESWGLILLLIGEAFGAFLVVTFIVGVLFQDILLALLLGSIAMATAPASTSEVIREYKSSGPLSQTILFIIAFDDILAILFFNISISFSKSVFTGLGLSLVDILIPIIFELGGSIILGTILAAVIVPFRIDNMSAGKSAEVVFPVILICIALAGLLELSVILSCITFGLVLSNLVQCENKVCIMSVDRLSTPLIALFFILIGFEMELAELFTGTMVIILIYFFARILGKSVGSYSTARIAKMPETVKNNIPFSLLTQAGVAVGLAALAYSNLLSLNVPAATTTAIILLDIITVSVLMAEIVGPLLLKYALRKAGEINVTSDSNSVDDTSCS
jgi:Kef-type K+ transport system membrane component KefB